MPAREAFTLGKVMVAPSRAESLPYIVMESIAAGKPIVATDVGGVGEIFGPFRDQLIPRDDAKALARAMIAALRRPGEEQAADSARLAAYVAENFSLAALVDQGLAAYREALARLGAA
jgi:glycosyltransferase involved in cell wall biosynthesis